MVAERRTPGRSCAEGRSGVVDDELQGGAGASPGLQAAGEVEEGAGVGDQAAAERLIGAAECDGRQTGSIAVDQSAAEVRIARRPDVSDAHRRR